MKRNLCRHIRRALDEDIGAGDLTSRYFLPWKHRSEARMLVKEGGVLCGGELAAAVFEMVDPDVEVEIFLVDGQTMEAGDVILEVRGATASLLTAERVALNFIQKLCGIATLTRRFVEAVRPSEAVILDTRKTTPGLRELEKLAVLAGGGKNHRMGLYDMVMVKDNHYEALGGVGPLQEAIWRFKKRHPGFRVEVEAATLQQVRDFVTLEGLDVMLLDNMSLDELQKAVILVDGRVTLEASGGVSLETVKAIAATGVDYISVGTLTHSAKALDISLDLVPRL